MKKENDLTQEILSSLKYLKRPSLSPALLAKIESRLPNDLVKVIPLRQIKRLMVAASILVLVNTMAIVYSVDSESSADDYIAEGGMTSLVSDYTIYK